MRGFVMDCVLAFRLMRPFIPRQGYGTARCRRGRSCSKPPIRAWLAAKEKQQQAIRAAFPQTSVSVAVKPRMVRVLPRGNWLDDSGEVVEPNTPAVLATLNNDEGRATRRDLADWFVSRENPLVARVAVNRLWNLFYGRGIVASLDDFGTQGQWPTHPELLDWLAVEFIDSGWNVKHMVKLMVMSRTYRQSSFVTPLLRELDPGNQWLARQSRYRLDAEMVRDNALAISGLLSRKIGGPSMKPYQPAGYWQHLNFPKRKWQPSSGEDLYRRGLYTYWQRTFLHPSLLAFDAPSREECTVERPRSNTPLQALVLLNYPTYVEAEVLGKLYAKHLAQYRADPQSAANVLLVGANPAPEDMDKPELAAWTSVA